MLVGEVTVVIGLYVLVRLYHILNLDLMLAYGAFTFATGGCLKIGIQFAVSQTESSEKIHKLSLNERMSKKDRVFFLSCQPLKSKIGNFFTLTRETFPAIMDKIIISNLINLIVQF
jgi:hypothetical protein